MFQLQMIGNFRPKKVREFELRLYFSVNNIGLSTTPISPKTKKSTRFDKNNKQKTKSHIL